MGHALPLCQGEPIEKPIERRAEDAAQILSRKKERGWDVNTLCGKWFERVDPKFCIKKTV